MLMPVKNIKTIDIEGEETQLYFSAEMIEKGFYIRVRLDWNEKTDDFLEILEINHCILDENRVLTLIENYDMYYDRVLAPIEMYRIIRDLQELFWLYTIDSNEPFLKILDEMFVGKCTVKNKDGVFFQSFERDLRLISGVAVNE
jgi:hypothetical protein